MRDNISFNREYNYIQDYYKHLYKVYADKYTSAYPVTYYSIDTQNSIWDTDKIMAGTYSRRGVGEFSGLKFKKILLLPVMFMAPIENPQNESNEYGYSMHGSLKTTLVIPSVYGIIPSPDDRIDISFAFQSEDSINIKGLYAVTNVNPAHIGEEFTLYQLLINVDYNTGLIEQQISSYWSFYEHERKILPLDNVKTLLTLQDRYKDTVKYINKTIYNDQTGLYLNKTTI